MKSVRLAQHSRADIAISVMAGFEEAYFSKQPYKTEQQLRIAIEKEHITVMNRLWQRCYGHVNLSGIPDFMITDSAFAVSCSGSSRVESMRLSKKPGKRTAIDMIIDDESEFQLYDKLRAELSAYNKEFEEYRREVQAVLESVTTTKQLVELWPNIEQYIPAHLADPERGVKLPALHISRLDERLAK